MEILAPGRLINRTLKRPNNFCHVLVFMFLSFGCCLCWEKSLSTRKQSPHRHSVVHRDRLAAMFSTTLARSTAFVLHLHHL